MTTSTLDGCTVVAARACSAELPVAHPKIDNRPIAIAAGISTAERARHVISLTVGLGPRGTTVPFPVTCATSPAERRGPPRGQRVRDGDAAPGPRPPAPVR